MVAWFHECLYLRDEDLIELNLHTLTGHVKLFQLRYYRTARFLYAPVQPYVTLAFGFPPGTSRKFSFPEKKPVFLKRLLVFKSPSSIDLLEPLAPYIDMPEPAPCGRMPELLAPYIDMPEPAPCGRMPELLAPYIDMPEPAPCGRMPVPLAPCEVTLAGRLKN
jgi:hypothetical protein